MSESNQVQALSRDEALKVYKMYEDKGWAGKQQMVAIVAWLTPFVFGLLAFSARYYYSDPTSPIANLASFAAVLLSAFMVFLVFGSLRHANRDYEKAYQVLDQAEGVLHPDILDTFQRMPYELLPRLLRFGMPRIGGMHIFLMYSAIFLLILSATALKTLIILLGTFCPDSG